MSSLKSKRSLESEEGVFNCVQLRLIRVRSRVTTAFGNKEVTGGPEKKEYCHSLN
jgi:hypothetical protein